MKPGSLAAHDPFGAATDQVQMNPGYQHPDLVEPAGPTDPDVSVLSRADAARPAHRAAGQLLAALRRRRAARCRPTTSAPSPSGCASCSGRRPTAVRRHHVQRHQRRHQQRQLRRAAARQTRGRRTDPHRRRQRRQGAAWPRTRRSSTTTGSSLAHGQKEIELGVRLPTEDDVSPGRSRSWSKAKGPVLKTMPEVYARETVLLAKYPPKVKVILQALRIGELGIVAIPVRDVRRDRPGDQEEEPAAADLHDRAGQRLQRLPADAGAATPSAATRPGGRGRATWRSNASRAITDTLLGLLKEVESKN